MAEDEEDEEEAEDEKADAAPSCLTLNSFECHLSHPSVLSLIATTSGINTFS